MKAYCLSRCVCNDPITWGCVIKANRILQTCIQSLKIESELCLFLFIARHYLWMHLLLWTTGHWKIHSNNLKSEADYTFSQMRMHIACTVFPSMVWCMCNINSHLQWHNWKPRSLYHRIQAIWCFMLIKFIISGEINNLMCTACIQYSCPTLIFRNELTNWVHRLFIMLKCNNI